MKELKRLSTGFISALMVLTMILMPIPQTNRAWAADDDVPPADCIENPTENDNGIYKPGCEMTDAMSKASLDNPGLYKDGKIGQLIEQYIMGLFGLTLINGLMWRYLYKYNPAIYGHDCPANWGPKITMPLTALSGLAYVIGDAQANVKFKIASKEATDNAFAAKSKNYIPDADSDEVKQAKEEGEQDPRIKAVLENKAQEDSYDALINILKAQKAAVKTKRNLTRVSNLGYYTATGAELANILLCNADCAASQGVVATKFDAVKSLVIASNAAILAAPKTGVNPAAVAALKIACEPALVANQALAANIGVDLATGETFAVADAAITVGEQVEKISFFKKIWNGIKGFFAVAAPEAVVASQIADAFGDEVVDEALETGKATAKMSKEELKSIAAMKSALMGVTLDKAVLACPPAIKVVKEFVSAYGAWQFAPVTCCGGNGNSVVVYIKLMTQLVAMFPDNPFYQAMLAAMKAELTAESTKAADLVALASAVPGTFNYQGPPLKSIMISKEDIKIGGLFGGVVNYQDPKIKKMLKDRKEIIRTVMRSGIESLMLNLYTDKQMQNPKEYIRIVAENSKRIDLVMEKFDREILNDIDEELAQNKFDKVQDKMKKFVKKISNILVPEAHAIGGMGLAAGGMLLTMVGSQVENPWVKEIFNLGGKLLMLQGLLGKLMKNYALNRPIGRNITWGLMGGIGEFIIASLKKTEEKIQKNIDVVEFEKARYMKSAAARTGIGDYKVKGNGKVNLQKYDPTALGSNAMKIRACAVPNGNGFSPAMCPAVIPKSKFSLPELKGKMRKHLTPDFLKGMSMMSSYAHGAATGSINGETMSDSDLSAIDQVSNAMKAHNDLLRDKVDEHNSKIKLKDGKKYPSLKATIASFKRGFGSGSAGGSSAAPLASTGGEAYQRRGGKVTTNNVVNKGKKPTTSVGGGSVAAVKAPDFDLDFGDEDAGGVANADGTAADSAGTKGPEKLEDFVLKHDDINKRSEVPIWKILSNRYILSYPKILEEEDAKLEPEQVKDKKK